MPNMWGNSYRLSFWAPKSLQMVTELSWNFLPYYLFNYLLLCFSSPVLGSVQFSSVVQSCPTLCDPVDCSIRPPCPSPTPRVYSNSSPLIWWCHPAISSSVTPFSRLQSFSASGFFQWVSSSHQVAKVLGFQLQHQSFHCIFRTDFL